MTEARGEYAVTVAVPVAPTFIETLRVWECSHCKERLGVIGLYRWHGVMWELPHPDGAVYVMRHAAPICNCGEVSHRSGQRVKQVRYRG